MKRNQKYIVSFIFFSFLFMNVYGEEQQNDYAPRDYSIIPPTPEVSSLIDFQEFPINYFRGLPQISYPIFTLKCGEIEVPITLSYHSGGIRNAQKCGNAGTGWDITFGAVIGHTVYGAPDDANKPNMHGMFHLTTDERQFRKNLTKKIADYDPTEIDHYHNENYWQAELGMNNFQGKTDVANDLYNPWIYRECSVMMIIRIL